MASLTWIFFVSVFVQFGCQHEVSGDYQSNNADVYEEMPRIELVHPLHRTKRKILLFDVHSKKKWPTKISYFIQSNFTWNQKRFIRKVLQEDFEANTCLSFNEQETPVTRGTQFMYFRSTGRGGICKAYVGLVNDTTSLSGQPVYVGDACFQERGYLIYLIAATLGMHGEQQRTDRDLYVDIMHENILQDMRSMYSIYSEDQTTTHDIPYDYGSVLHIGVKDSLGREEAYSDKFTILPKDRRYTRTLGQRSEFSFYDIQALETAYCSNRIGGCAYSMCANGGYVGSHCRCKCPDGFAGESCQDIIDGSDTCAPSSGIFNVNEALNCIAVARYPPPSLYSSTESCTWLLKAPTGRHIDLWFDIEPTLASNPGLMSCKHWVEIKLDGRADVRGLRYCNKVKTTNVEIDELTLMNPPTYTSPLTTVGNEAMILYRTPGSIPSSTSGFKLCYRLSSKVSVEEIPNNATKNPPVPTNEPVHDREQVYDATEDNGLAWKLGLGLSALVFVLILLVLCLVCFMCRRSRKNVGDSQNQQQQVNVAYINPEYTSQAAASVTDIVDVMKKEPPPPYEPLQYEQKGAGSNPDDNSSHYQRMSDMPDPRNENDLNESKTNIYLST